MSVRTHKLDRQGRIALDEVDERSVGEAEALLLRETGEPRRLVGIKLRPMAMPNRTELSDRYMYEDEYEKVYRQLEKEKRFSRRSRAATVGRASRAGKAGLSSKKPHHNALVWSRGSLHIVIAEHESGAEFFIPHAVALLASNADKIKEVAGLLGSVIGTVKGSVDLIKSLRKNPKAKARRPDRHFIPSDFTLEAHIGDKAKVVAKIPLSGTEEENRQRIVAGLAELGEIVRAAGGGGSKRRKA